MVVLSAKRLALLHVARRRLGLDEGAWRGLLAAAAGVRSSRNLDADGFEAVMLRLEAAGFRSTSKRKPLPARRGMASPREVQMIRALWGLYTGDAGDDRSLGKWLHGRFGVSDVRSVDAGLARKAIGGLRAMLAKKRPSAAPTAAA
jgi:Protein of unknown function (DUF1018)